MNFGLAVCAPAFPELGRTTVGGYQLLGGMPVSGADMAGPDIPPQHAFIPDLLNTGSNRKTALVDLKTVQEGATAIREAVAGFRAEPGTTVVVDMADPTCWNRLLDAVLENSAMAARSESPAATTASALLCGSGGMAVALADRLASARKPPAASSTRNLRFDSASPETKGQSRPRLRLQPARHDRTPGRANQQPGFGDDLPLRSPVDCGRRVPERRNGSTVSKRRGGPCGWTERRRNTGSPGSWGAAGVVREVVGGNGRT